MAKLIRFDLPINGTKVKDLEELHDNLTEEIVTLARSGQLARWLTTRGHLGEAGRVTAAVESHSDDIPLCLALCEAIGAPVHLEDVEAIFGSIKSAGHGIGGHGNSESIEETTNETTHTQCADIPEPADYQENEPSDIYDKLLDELLVEEKMSELADALAGKRLSRVVQERLFHSGLDEAKVILAGNDSTSDEFLMSFAKTGTRIVRETLAANSAINIDVQCYLLTQESDDFANNQRGLFEIPNISDAFSGRSLATNIHVALAGNPGINFEIQKKLMGHEIGEVKHAIAQNPSIAKEIQIYLIENYERGFRCCFGTDDMGNKYDLNEKYYLAGNPNVCHEIQKILMEDNDESVKSALAANENLLDIYHDVLVMDSNYKIRTGLAKNPNLKEQHMVLLAGDSSDNVLESLAGNCNLSDSLQASLLRRGGSKILVALAGNKSLGVKLQGKLSESKEIDIIISLWGNSCLSEDLRSRILHRFTAEEFEDFNRKLQTLDKRHKLALQAFHAANEKAAIYDADSFFSSKSRYRSLWAESRRLEDDCDNIYYTQYKPMKVRVEKYKAILEAKGRAVK